MHYYISFEQFLCSILANYKRTISVSEINKIIYLYKATYPDDVIAMDTIRFINELIGYGKEYIWLKSEYINENNEVYENLKNSLNNIGGIKLKEFIEKYANEKVNTNLR